MTTRRTFLLLLVLALVVRAAAAFWQGVDTPLVEDERGYVGIAASLTAGDGFALPPPAEIRAAAGDVEVPPRRSFRGPLLPILLAPLGSAPARLRLLQVLIGALGPPLLYLALRQAGLARFALGAAAAYAVWPPAVYLSTRVLSEPLSMTLLLGALACMGEPEPVTRRRSAAAGALAALAVLARPATLAPAALLALTRGRRGAIAFGLTFAVLLAPWIVRNGNLHGRPLLTTNAGVTFLGGNCRAALDAPYPGKWVPPDVAYAGRDDAPDLGLWGWSARGEAASDRRFGEQGVAFLRGHPGDAARLWLHKLVRLFDPDPRSGKADAGRKRLLGWLTLPPILLLLPLGVWQLRGRTDVFPWAALLFGTIATAVVFYGDTRMRTAADPALLLFATAGATLVVDRIRRGRLPEGG